MKIAQLSIALELLKNNSLENINHVIDMGTKSLRVKYNDLEYLFKQANTIKNYISKYIKKKNGIIVSSDSEDSMENFF